MKTNMKKVMSVLLASLMILSVLGIASVSALQSNAASVNPLGKILAKVNMSSSDDVYTAVKDYLPESYDKTASSLQETNTLLVHRFILWTHDGVHSMWGKYANNRFTGEDNLGVKSWGIYYNGFFAGFYGDKFFYGRYTANSWTAKGLFGENFSYGNFVTFPRITNTNAVSVSGKTPAGQNLLSSAN